MVCKKISVELSSLDSRPLGAGSSFIDMMGGTLAAVVILAALRER